MTGILPFFVFLILALRSDAFVNPTRRTNLQATHGHKNLSTSIPFQPFSNPNLIDVTTKSTSLQMGYNLPPGGGGSGGGPKDAITSFLQPIALIAATVLFFLSPLGSIFFAITNSIFLLLLITPFVAALGFNIWQTFYTIEAPCPNCGAPARVLKDEEAGPNLCLNCGTLLRANVDKDGIEMCNNPNDIYDDKSRISSIFDLFSGGVDNEAADFLGGNGGGFMDFGEKDDKKDKKRRESTIIDVDVTKDD